MPAGITASDRKLLIWGGALLAVMILLSAFLTPREQSESPIPSTYSTAPRGAQAAYLLLRNLGYPARRWFESPTDLSNRHTPTLLLIAEPMLPPTDAEKAALHKFVEDGGHILFTGGAITDYFPEAKRPRPVPIGFQQKFSPLIPSGATTGAPTVQMKSESRWEELEPSQVALYSEKAYPVVVAWELGKGEILWWGGSTPLTNEGLPLEQNLHFFLNSVRNWTKQPYEILWDEYFHGRRDSILSYFFVTSLRWGIPQLLILAIAALFTFSRRSGPVFRPAATSRLSPLEFVDTLGGLYENAGAASSAVAVSYHRFRSLLTRQLALPFQAPSAELAVAAEQRLGWKNSGLGLLMSRSEVAMREKKLPPSEALSLVQQLEEYSGRLTIRNPLRREKS